MVVYHSIGSIPNHVDAKYKLGHSNRVKKKKKNLKILVDFLKNLQAEILINLSLLIVAALIWEVVCLALVHVQRLADVRS